MSRKVNKAIDTLKGFQKESDISHQELEEILQGIAQTTGFLPEKNIFKSRYWGSERVGAAHYLGKYENKPAVLKIQGDKPAISEAWMIKQFNEQNRSQLIRPPSIYTVKPWGTLGEYEAIIMEHISGGKILLSKQLQDSKTLETFFKLYQEYRKNCLPQNPWLDRPEKPNLHKIFDQLSEVSNTNYPDHPFRQENDKTLTSQALKLLTKIYDQADTEFVHGHFSAEDLAHQGDEIVLFSNLFWKWKYPLYDAVFAYHWAIFELASVPNITPGQVEEQRALWLNQILNLPQINQQKNGQTLIKAALLERAIAGLVIDGLLMDKEKPISDYIHQSTRDQVRKLTNSLN